MVSHQPVRSESDGIYVTQTCNLGKMWPSTLTELMALIAEGNKYLEIYEYWGVKCDFSWNGV